MELSKATRVVHSGHFEDKHANAIIPPIYQTSTYRQNAPGEHKGYDYSRADNPTREALEQAYAQVEEGARYALTFATGLAAVQAIIQTLPATGKVLVSDDVYGGTGRLFRRLFTKYGFEFVFLDMSNTQAIAEELDSKVKLIWVESPSNPMMKILDLQSLAKQAKENGAYLVVDNTFASPIFQSPLKLGADIVLYSSTKYLGGHSDLLGGAIMLADTDLYEQLRFTQFAAGAIPSPLECFLLHRSLKTLAIRMEAHQRNGQAIAEFLEKHPKIKKVLYPGLSSHPQYTLAKEQMLGQSGMLSFVLHGDYEQVKIFLKQLKLISLAESLGGVESLINHPEKMTHASVPEPLREKLGINSQLLRISAGVEAADDLMSDLKQALDKTTK